MPLDGGIAASRADNGSSTPSAHGRAEIAEGTQGPPAEGGKVDKNSAAGVGVPVLGRNVISKQASVSALIPRGETYAVLYVAPDAASSGTDVAFVTQNFLLTSVVAAKQERYQIVETFIRHLIYFMGKAPEIYKYSGTLYDAKNAEWFEDFEDAYENHLRGTKCVENRTRVFLDYEGRLVTGYMLSCMFQKMAEQPFAVQFSFDLFITSRRRLGGKSSGTSSVSTSPTGVGGA